MNSSGGDQEQISAELQNKLIDALSDYFASVEIESPVETPSTQPPLPIEWSLGYEGLAKRWPVDFVQIREGGDGIGEFPAYSACVSLSAELKCILSFHVRFVLYKNGVAHGVHHHDPEWPITEFDWNGPFVVAACGNLLHLFEQELYVDMTQRSFGEFLDY
jgi:hypothetical protein